MKKHLISLLLLITALFSGCNNNDDGGKSATILPKNVKSIKATAYYIDEDVQKERVSHMEFSYNQSGKMNKISFIESVQNSFDITINYEGDRIFYTAEEGIDLDDLGYYTVFHSNYHVDRLQIGTEESFSKAEFTYSDDNRIKSIKRTSYDPEFPIRNYTVSWENDCLNNFVLQDSDSDSPQREYKYLYGKYKNNLNIDFASFYTLQLPFARIFFIHNEFGARSKYLPEMVTITDLEGVEDKIKIEYTVDKSGYLKEIIIKHMNDEGEFVINERMILTY